MLQQAFGLWLASQLSGLRTLLSVAIARVRVNLTPKGTLYGIQVAVLECTFTKIPLGFRGGPVLRFLRMVAATFSAYIDLASYVSKF